MLNKRKFLIKLCAALPAALLLTTTPVLADENDQTNQPQTSETNKQNVTYQSLYWRCINQYTGQTLQVMYADTVKVVNGVPERQFFNMGQLPERIGDFEIAGNPLIVDVPLKLILTIQVVSPTSIVPTICQIRRIVVAQPLPIINNIHRM